MGTKRYLSIDLPLKNGAQRQAKLSKFKRLYGKNVQIEKKLKKNKKKT